MKKALGVVRKIDDLGRIVIPKEVRRTQGWDTGQPMEMFMQGNELVMKAYSQSEEKQRILRNLENALDEIQDEKVKADLNSTIYELHQRL